MIIVDRDDEADGAQNDREDRNDPEDREERLDRAFAALGDPVRRAIVARLSRGEATVNELAEPFTITKQAVSRHIQVLEAAGLITRTRNGQRRPCHLNETALEELTSWIDRYRLAAEQRHRRLDALLATMRAEEEPTADSRTPPKEQQS